MMLPIRPLPSDLRMLTALRAAAALLVALYHFADRTEEGSILHATLFTRGQLGVDIFFVLSGFILAHVYLERCAAGRFSLRDFLVNRFARLYPMHALTLVATALLGWLAWHHGLPIEAYGPHLGIDPATGRFSPWSLLSNLALVHAWAPLKSPAFNVVSWSISAETFAYLLFPAIAAMSLAFGRRAGLRLLAAALFYGLCESIARSWLGHSLTGLAWSCGVLRIAPEFTLGVATYGFVAGFAFSRRTLSWLAPAAVAATLALMIAGAPLVLLPLAFAAMIGLIADSERAGLVMPQWLLRPLVYLGEISYSVYMMQLLVGSVTYNVMARAVGTDPHAASAWLVLPALAVLLAASALCYHVVEQPGRRVLREVLKGRVGSCADVGPVAAI